MPRRRVKSVMNKMRSDLEKSHPELIQQMLPPELLQEVLSSLQLKFRQRVYTPIATLWLWLGQVFDSDGSTRQAVAQAFGWLLADRKDDCSTDCSAYSRARNRLAEALPQKVTEKVAQDMELYALDPRFHRRVWLFDGTTCTAADTVKNQKAYAQPPTQKPGCGFPMMRMVGMFSLATGLLHGLKIGSYFEGEHSLFRALWEKLGPKDIVIADALFNSYVNVALLLRRGVDSLFKQDSRRNFDFRKAKKRLGPRDAIFTLTRPFPSHRPDWMTQRKYLTQIPETLEVRVLEHILHIPGFRVRKLRLITTLLDPIEFPAEVLAALYAKRWHIELNFRDIKSTLGMDHLDLQSPQMIRKDIWMHMLAYNLIRKVMWDTHLKHGRPIEDLSFKGTLQLVEAVANAMGAKPRSATKEAYQALLKGINQRPVRRRPHRSEPRVVKMRRQRYPRMTRPRHASINLN